MTDHPFRTAWRTRNLDEWIDWLSADVVLSCTSHFEDAPRPVTASRLLGLR